MDRRARLCLMVVVVLGTAELTTAEKSAAEPRKFETVQNSNEAIFNLLGLGPLRIPDGHHKKRLAGPEPSNVMDISLGAHTRLHQPYSRLHGHRDSHVYIVKLPPSPPYYALTKPSASKKVPISTAKESEKLSKIKKPIATSIDPQVGFHGNGKPAKIYHWNLPLMKKINEKKRQHTQMRMEQMRKRLENEINDQQMKKYQHRINEKPEAAMMMLDAAKVSVEPKKSAANAEINGKHYHRGTSGNTLNRDEKPAVKHTRNNDKRLNYPKTTEELRKSGQIAGKNGRNEDNETKNKMSRLEDSSVYEIEQQSRNNERRKNTDRLAVWRLSNELNASENMPASSLRPKKHRKKAAMSYYAPIARNKIHSDAGSATNIHKNFPGNGKPKAFYVMEKSRHPVYYHPLLP